MALPEAPKRHSGPGIETPGFGSNSFGMKVAPVEHIVKQKTRASMAENPEVWKEYNALSRHIRIVNRGAKGPCKGKAFLGVHDGQLWPDAADPEDPETWLQPGEYMDVPKDVALHLVGNVWDPKLPSRQDIIRRYGDVAYEIAPGGKTDPRNTPMTAIDAAPVPDLIVCEISGDKPLSEYKAIFELYQPDWAKKELVTA